LEGSLEEAEVVDVEHVTLGRIGSDSVELDVVDLFADTEGVDGGLLLEAARLDLEHWWISGSAVGDEEDLVGDFRSIAEFRSESVLDNPLDGGTGVSSSSFIDDRIDSVNSLLVVFHFVHVESESWSSVVSDQTDSDSVLAEVGLHQQVDNEVLHLLEVLVANGGGLIENDEEVELVVGILSVALSLAAGSLFNELAEDVGPFARLGVAGGLVDTSKIESGWAGEVASRAVVNAVGAAELDNVGDGFSNACLRIPAFALVLVSVLVDVPAAVGALAGGLVAAEVAVNVVDVSAATGFSGAEGFAIYVVGAATDGLDVDWLLTTSDTSVGCGSCLFAEKSAFLIDRVIKVREKVLWGGVLSEARWVSIEESLELLRGSVGSEADFFRQSDGIVSFVVEDFGNEGIHWLEGSVLDIWLCDVRVVKLLGSCNLFVCHQWGFASKVEFGIYVLIIIILSISGHAG